MIRTIHVEVPIEIIKRWSDDFDCLMKHEVAKEIFRESLRVERCEENMNFYDTVQLYKLLDRSNDDEKSYCKRRARKIFDLFMNTDTATEINIDDAAR